jgi:hypothetical protein
MRTSRRVGPLLAAIGLVVIADAPKTTMQPPTPPAFQILESSIDTIQAALASKQITCRVLIEQYLRRIDTFNKNGPTLNAIETVNPRALEEADRLDAAFRSSGPVGALHCVPVLVKDQLETSDMATRSDRRCSATSSRSAMPRSCPNSRRRAPSLSEKPRWGNLPPAMPPLCRDPS